MASATFNEDNLLYAEVDNAKELYARGNVEKAADECCKLVGNILCPRLLQVWTWQLRSVCMSE